MPDLLSNSDTYEHDHNWPLSDILLIDDDPISREVLAMLLDMEGFSVTSAEDGAQALNILGELRPQIILMDSQMPGLSGLELINSLRSQSSARIIAISGSEIEVSIRKAADGFLLKPIEVADLRALLQDQKSAPGQIESVNASTQIEPELATDAEEQTFLINPVVLNKLKEMMPPSAVHEIYTAVATDLVTRLASLKKAMDSENSPEVARIAHSIKGGCAIVGLSGAMQAAARLENSNLCGTWPEELSNLQNALTSLQSIVGGGLL
jgi:CheY-like chemotaxis protein